VAHAVLQRSGGKLAGYRESWEQAVQAAAEGATVLVGNTRAARCLLHAAQELLRRGHAAWETPRVLPLAVFIEKQLAGAAQSAGLFRRGVLSDAQELQLWREIIAASPAGAGMLLPESAAVLAQSSLRTAEQYGLNLKAGAMSASAETRAFSGWAAEFRDRLRAEGWCCPPELAREMTRLVKDHGAELSLPQNVFVFHPALVPAEREFLAALAAAGVQVQEADAFEACAVDATRHGFGGESEELNAAALWARQKVEDDPLARVGVVLFDLERRREQVESVFRSVLHPEQLLGARAESAFEIASAPSLASYPAVLAALRWLRLLSGPVEFHDFMALMRSPYFVQDVGRAAAFVARVRRNALRQVSYADFAEWLRDFDGPEELRRATGEMPSHEAFDSTQSAGYWSRIARELLRRVGWPAAVLDSDAYQSTQAWREVMNEAAALERVSWRGDFASFVALLGQMAAARGFKPESLAAPVQIMDAREAEGSVFDALWLGACTDELWPAAQKPSPLLPLELLEKAGYPLVGSDAQQAAAERTTARLLQSAQRVELSLALRTAEERTQRWSPAFATVPLAEKAMAQPLAIALRVEPAELESLADEKAPPRAADESIRGGTGLIKEQAECPFRAFAIRRLGAAELEGPREAMEANERGMVVETALQLVWEKLGNSAALLSDDLEMLVHEAVAEAMREKLPARRDKWIEKFRELEAERTERVLLEWLRLESTRPAFEVLEHQRQVQLKLGELELTGKVDRIDSVHGAQVVIDYKTGRDTQPKNWEVPRPLLPQLPLYALALREEHRDVAGIAFAVVRPGEVGFKGFLRDGDLLGIKNKGGKAFDGQSFDEYMPRWEQELRLLADGFLAGDAEVDPKIATGKNGSPCERCHLDGLCRVKDGVAVDEDEDAPEDADE
jgi:probable DNA repair protein